MSRLIDADKLIHNLKKWSDISPTIQRRNEDFIKILKNEDAVKTIPLDRIKAVKDGISDFDVNTVMDGCSEPFRLGVAKGLDVASVILDKLIESEGKE